MTPEYKARRAGKHELEKARLAKMRNYDPANLQTIASYVFGTDTNENVCVTLVSGTPSTEALKAAEMPGGFQNLGFIRVNLHIDQAVYLVGTSGVVDDRMLTYHVSTWDNNIDDMPKAAQQAVDYIKGASKGCGVVPENGALARRNCLEYWAAKRANALAMGN